MSKILQLGVLVVWLGWMIRLTISTDILIMREGPGDFSRRGPGFGEYGVACTYFTTLGMTTRFYEMAPGTGQAPPPCPDRLWST